MSTLQKTPIKQHFSAFGAAAEQPLYYFDSAATACMPTAVKQALCDFYDHAHGNVHRGVYAPAEHTTSMHEQVRAKIQRFLGAADPSEIIFTGGATDSLNAVAHMWAYDNLVPGDVIIITQAEHHAHYVLWHEVAKKTGAIVHVLPIDPVTYCVDLSTVPALINEKLKIVAVTGCSNVIGPIWGAHDALLHQLIAHVRSVDAKVIIDAAQVAPHRQINVQKLDCDFLALAPHKMGGPTGVGILYARKQLHDQLRPFRFGGGMVAAIAGEYMTWQEAPHKFEAGTPPIAQVVGMGALIDFYTQQVDFEHVAHTEAALCAQLIDGLTAIDGVQVVGNHGLLAAEGHVVSWYVDDMHAHDLATSLSSYGCCVRAGDHCAQPLAQLWQGKATVRASLFMYNTADDIAYLIDAVKHSIAQWRQVMR